jgi:dihydroorotate dehydrogenase
MEVAGLRFPNPVGLAAGFDKDATYVDALPALGFGFIEVGTITPRAQPGNPRPRLFRFPAEQALVNRMGFNNAGAEAAAAQLRQLSLRPVPIGVNLGLNKDTPSQHAADEYARAFTKLYVYGDYFVVNVSSPNTPGLRRLQDKIRLERILARLAEYNVDNKPIFVKLAPDLEDAEVVDLVPLLQTEAAGVIATNTTLSRVSVSDEALHTSGGLSGAPLRDPATTMIRRLRELSDGRLPIIGVGGIFSAEDAYQKIRAGASLVQVYTGFIYQGPSMAADINRGLLRIAKAHGLATIGDAVGRSLPEAAAS